MRTAFEFPCRFQAEASCGQIANCQKIANPPDGSAENASIGAGTIRMAALCGDQSLYPC